jgi:hypothetical protein
VDANWAWAQLVQQIDRRPAGGAIGGDPGTGGGRLFKPEAREAQRQRFAGATLSCNADMGPTEVRKICRLDEIGRGLVKAAMLAGASEVIHHGDWMRS